VLAVSGEKKLKEKDVLDMVHGAMQAGASGVSLGRTIFQYKKPGNMIKAVNQIVHKGFSAETASKTLKEPKIESPLFGETPIW
jgi:DhnA family fructose-bisphosphate aldolase class Ia